MEIASPQEYFQNIVAIASYFLGRVPRNDRVRVVCDVQRCHCEEWSDSGMTWQSRVDECVRSDDTNMVIRDCFTTGVLPKYSRYRFLFFRSRASQ